MAQFVGTKLLYHRKYQLTSLTSERLTPAISRRVLVCPRGAQVDGTQSSVTTITVISGHNLQIGHKFIVNTTGSTLRTVTGATATTVTFTGALSVTDADLLVNLGNDGGTTSPNYDSTTVPLYTNVKTTSALSPSRVTSDGTTGDYEYWSTERRVWELVFDSSNALDEIVRDVELDRVEDVVLLRQIDTAANAGNPTSLTECRVYMVDTHFVIQYNDGGTLKYRSLDLSSTNATWTYGVAEPT